MKEGICKLCLQNKKLCKESHIIPSFLYNLLYSNNHSLVFVDNKKSKTKFNGEYEGGILCEDCDRIVIGQLDDYAAKFMQGDFPPITPRKEKRNGRDIVIRENDPNYNYNKFKLFWLSVLWRSSICTRPFFKQLKLLPEMEEDLRKRILGGKAGKPDEYPCFIHLPPLITQQDGTFGLELMYMPTRSPLLIKKDDVTICEFVILGCYYFFILERPTSMKVEPSIDEQIFTFSFRTMEEQTELIRQTLKLMKSHVKPKKDL